MNALFALFSGQQQQQQHQQQNVQNQQRQSEMSSSPVQANPPSAGGTGYSYAQLPFVHQQLGPLPHQETQYYPPVPLQPFPSASSQHRPAFPDHAVPIAVKQALNPTPFPYHGHLTQAEQSFPTTANSLNPSVLTNTPQAWATVSYPSKNTPFSNMKINNSDLVAGSNSTMQHVSHDGPGAAGHIEHQTMSNDNGSPSSRDNASPAVTAEDTEDSAPRKRGRPKGAKDKEERSRTMKRLKRNAPTVQADVLPGSSNSTQNSDHGDMTPASSNATPSNEQPDVPAAPRPRGRPKGSKDTRPRKKYESKNGKRSLREKRETLQSSKAAVSMDDPPKWQDTAPEQDDQDDDHDTDDGEETAVMNSLAQLRRPSTAISTSPKQSPQKNSPQKYISQKHIEMVKRQEPLPKPVVGMIFSSEEDLITYAKTWSEQQGHRLYNLGGQGRSTIRLMCRNWKKPEFDPPGLGCTASLVATKPELSVPTWTIVLVDMQHVPACEVAEGAMHVSSYAELSAKLKTNGTKRKRAQSSSNTAESSTS